MTLLLYAITTAPTAEPSRQIVRASGVVAWTCDLGSAPSPFTKEALLEHHRVVTEVFEQVDACLPARFPTVFEGEDALRGELEQRSNELAAQLEGVRGAAELAVTAVWTSPDETPPEVEPSSPGREYLLRRQAVLTASERRRGQAEALAEQLEQAAGAALRTAERHVCPSAEVALSLALLVQRGAAEDVQRTLRRQMSPGVRILVHGPWPPYSFAQR